MSTLPYTISPTERLATSPGGKATWHLLEDLGELVAKEKPAAELRLARRPKALVLAARRGPVNTVPGTLPGSERLTPPDSERLRPAIARARRQGYAIEVDETDVGVTCIAAPIVSGDEAAGAISVSVPSARATGTARRQLVKRVREAAARASRRLG